MLVPIVLVWCCSYPEINELVNEMFPPRRMHTGRSGQRRQSLTFQGGTDAEFNAFNYWKRDTRAAGDQKDKADDYV